MNGEPRKIEIVEGAGDTLGFEKLGVLSAGGMAVLDDEQVEIKPGEHVLIVGRTGGGKSTLFRAFAGLWPWGTGRILMPPQARTMFLPQRPYLPPGPLRDALTYPMDASSFTDDEICAALNRTEMGHHEVSLDQVKNWDKELTSDELQTLTFARLLLHKPQWVFIDEMVDALDEERRKTAMSIFERELPETAVITIARREVKNGFYTRVLRLHLTDEVTGERRIPIGRPPRRAIPPPPASPPAPPPRPDGMTKRPAPARRASKKGAAALSDDALLDLVQRQTFRFFWDAAHPVSGMIPDRTDRAGKAPNDWVTTGGSGFGIMAIIVATERGWIDRAAAVERLMTIVRHLEHTTSHHGVFPHFLDGRTGATVSFSRKDDGGDLVETAFLFQGLLTARRYFDRDAADETELRNHIAWLWNETEWSWYTRGGLNVLFWHWGANNGWGLGHEIRGWNECLITYVMAAASPRYAIDAEVYHRGWAVGRYFLSQRRYYDIELPLGMPYGGPLFFSHYSFLGLDPRGLKDQYADYWEQNRRHTLINYEHCIRNPNGFKGYGPDCWGLTASDTPGGYSAHAPDNDLGVISPTAALSAMPYTPEQSMRALRHFYEKLGDRIWDKFGFVDAFSEQADWVADTHLAIDQGPIVVMIENHRTGLLWKLFMSDPDVQRGLRTLGFDSPHLGKR